MRIKGIFLAAFVAFLFVGTQSALAQRTADMSLTVTANNLGIFTCNLAAGSFDFGDVDADGTDFSTPSVTAMGRNGADDGGYYDADAATTWTCRAAPASIVAIALYSASGDHTVGTMSDDNLEVQIPDVDSGISTDYNAFTSGSPTPIDLITGLSVGNGANGVTGNLDLRLHVYDTDATGANTWIVRLRATGSP